MTEARVYTSTANDDVYYEIKNIASTVTISAITDNDGLIPVHDGVYISVSNGGAILTREEAEEVIRVLLKLTLTGEEDEE